jgi:hypothetical protein
MASDHDVCKNPMDHEDEDEDEDEDELERIFNLHLELKNLNGNPSDTPNSEEVCAYSRNILLGRSLRLDRYLRYSTDRSDTSY